MPFSNFLEKRKSVREYKEKNVKDSVLEQLGGYINEVQRQIGSDVEIVLFKDGNAVFQKLEGKGGYAGVMIKAPHYLGIVRRSNDKNIIVKTGYYVEDIITKASELGLGTCWVGLSNVPEDIMEHFEAQVGGILDYVIAFGYPYENNPLKSASTSSRLSVEEIVFCDEWGKSITIDELEKRGLDKLFYYIRYAPSSLNRQPWRFILRNDRVILALLKPDNIRTLIDGGIAMYYFEKMINSIGFKGNWEILNEEEEESNDDYFTVAQFMI